MKRTNRAKYLIKPNTQSKIVKSQSSVYNKKLPQQLITFYFPVWLYNYNSLPESCMLKVVVAFLGIRRGI